MKETTKTSAMIPAEKLRPFEGHPYKVLDDEEMDYLTESVREHGIFELLIVRPLEGTDEYEIISGHRRFRAAQRAGIRMLPALIRNVSRDEAAILLVDSNLHRQRILPSEKARAYKLKLEALEHQGKACGQVVHKSRDFVSDTDSGRQVQRYIRLTDLIPELLDMLDEGRIAFSVGVELSFLNEKLQRALLDACEENDCTPSYSQAVRMHKAANEGMLLPEDIYEIMSEEKANQQERLRIPLKDVRRFFPVNYTLRDIERAIIKILEEREQALIRKRLRENAR